MIPLDAGVHVQPLAELRETLGLRMTLPSHLEWAILPPLLERPRAWQIPANFSVVIFQVVYLI